MPPRLKRVTKRKEETIMGFRVMNIPALPLANAVISVSRPKGLQEA